jgi:hypothetical protein
LARPFLAEGEKEQQRRGDWRGGEDASDGGERLALSG